MLKNEKIENYSGVHLNLSKLVPSLKRNNWKELGVNIGGDAPKNFLAVYEYKRGSTIRKSNVDSWPKYIAKVGHKWYPIESINEYMFNQIGEKLGLNMAFSKLALINGQLRFMSRYFLNHQHESLIHGAEIFAGYVEDLNLLEQIEKEGLARKFFTFQFAEKAIRNVFPNDSQQILESLVKMLVFDAITGNNDRHFYNWGVVKDIKRRNCPKFAPIYDSARGLFWNDSESKIELWYKDAKQIDTRIQKYSEGSKPKIGWENVDDLNHFELITRIYQELPEYKGVLLSLINKENQNIVMRFLDMNFNSYLTSKRIDLIKRCLMYRFERLSIIVQE
jgi:hypothetical protein